LVAWACVFFLCAPGHAQDLRWESFTAASYNPLGFIEILTARARTPLYKSENPVLSTNFVDATAILASTPAYGLVGAQLQLQPLSVLRLRARYEGIFYFGNFGILQSFDSPNVDFSDSQLSKNQEAGLNRSTTGTRLTLTALFQGKIGPIAIRDHIQIARMDVDIPPETPIFYSPYYDHLLEDEAWVFQNDVDVLWVDDGLVLGVRYTTLFSQFSDRFVDDPNGPVHRIGPLAVLPLHRSTGTLDEINLIFLVNWYIQHRHRAGADSSQLVPYAAIAISFEGSLLSK